MSHITRRIYLFIDLYTSKARAIVLYGSLRTRVRDKKNYRVMFRGSRTSWMPEELYSTLKFFFEWVWVGTAGFQGLASEKQSTSVCPGVGVFFLRYFKGRTTEWFRIQIFILDFYGPYSPASLHRCIHRTP